MGKLTGFLEYPREEPGRRPASERIKDYREIELPISDEVARVQGARCMDCGVPFCNTGCPLGNLIPDFNDAVYRGALPQAVEELHATNNFPEFTGRVCPAPCEAACVLGITSEPVSIKLIEHVIADRGWEAELIRPRPAREQTGRRVAVIGSGPAGLACAQQLARAGHSVTVLERADRVGGLLTYGIPDFKLEKSLVTRRLGQLDAEGVVFRTGVEVGRDVTAAELRAEYDAVCLAIGSRAPRDLPIPGRELDGVHFALDFLEQQNRRVAGDALDADRAILATGKHVVVIGGGDTGSDCIGTSHRQGAKSVTSLELLPRPPDTRSPSTPWPMWPLMLRVSTSHEEGGKRDFSVSTLGFEGAAGRVTHLRCARVERRDGAFARVPGSEFELPADLVLLAMGFVHPEHDGLLADLGVALDRRGNVQLDAHFMSSVPGVFAAGDCQRGQSLVVWAIADGRRAAAAIDAYLVGGRSELT
ncbi:MAG: glutamate synthase subunit beta [Sorangiineae bacterium]|nr:glutamate synthase subunit beta [Polyangiaceae bacterium]MEB2322654.1 glutamate synthase subunit beta [Sorangiineae bacterium]